MEEDDDYEVEPPMGDMMGMMPMSFGKQDKKKDFTVRFDQTKRAQPQEPKKPSVNVAPVDDDSSDDMIGPMPTEENDDDETEEDEEEDDEFPVSHEIVLKDHAKVCFYRNRLTVRRSRQSRSIRRVQDSFLAHMITT
jgi:hypothetical protein